MNLKELGTILINEPKYRLSQINQAIFYDLIEDWNNLTVLPKNLREILSEKCDLKIKANIHIDKKDRTEKALLTLSDGEKVECVLIKHKDGRNTICVSSQVGCPLACPFCATGAQGFKRNLSYQEIIEQVLLFARLLKKESGKISNIVFMGMGEPFLNFDNVIAAIKILNDKKYFNIGARHISISTIGLIDGIKKITNEPLQLNLAISLHAPNDRLRNKLIKINRENPLSDLIQSVGSYVKKTNRKVMFEYIMLKDINDSEKEAEDLAKLLLSLDKRLFFVNLISYNETNKFEPSNKQTIDKFCRKLSFYGIKTTRRHKFGEDIWAACGQLAANDKI